MLRFFRFLPVLCLIAWFGAQHAAFAADHPTIRVAILKGASHVAIRATRGMLTLSGVDGGSEPLKSREFSIRAVDRALRVNGIPYPTSKVVIEGSPALYYMGNKKFRGLIRVYADTPGSLLVVNEIDIEDYLAGLINSEISSNWPIEAVKAQAVAARTYALHQVDGAVRNAPHALYDVESTVADQVYHGAHREDKRAYQGVRATTGMVLTRGGLIFPAFYHSACGGYTEHAHNAWSGMEGKGAVVDRFCRRSPYGAWFVRIPKVTFISTLTRAGLLGPAVLVKGIAQTPLPDSPRANEVVFLTDGKPIAVRATTLRRVMGYTKLKSTWFNVGFEGDEVVFAGRGFGHGVGLCQWGSKGMAEAGHSYRDILKHYYTDAEIGRLY